MAMTIAKSTINQVQEWVKSGWSHSVTPFANSKPAQDYSSILQYNLQENSRYQEPLEQPFAFFLVRHANFEALRQEGGSKLSRRMAETTRTILQAATGMDARIHQLSPEIYAVVLADMLNRSALERCATSIVAYGLHEWSLLPPGATLKFHICCTSMGIQESRQTLAGMASKMMASLMEMDRAENTKAIRYLQDTERKAPLSQY